MNRKMMLLFVIASVLFAACAPSANQAPTPTPAPTVNAGNPIIAEGRLEPIRYAGIAFNASGVISEVLVEEGQAVKRGDALMRLGDESDNNYASAQLELANAHKALHDLQNGAGTDLAQAVIDLKEATEEYNDAVDYLDNLKRSNKVPQTQERRFLVQTWKGYEYRVKTKSFKGPAPEDWIIEAQNDLALKKAKMDEVQRTYDRMKGGADADQLAVLEARLDAAKAGVAAFSVTAPFDGIVADLPAKLGNSISSGQSAVTIADFSHWVVNTTDLTEMDVVNLNEGDAVVVTLDALPDVELKGAIISIGQTYSEHQGDIVYKVSILLTNTDPAMRWGMTAAVNFENQD